jgi:hypothetical protein
MKRKVVYFSRTGTCKRIAEMIARSLSLDLVQLRDNQNWDGFIGYWKAGFFSSTNRDVKIEILGDLSDAEEVILVTPIWAGSIVPATKAFLKTFPRTKVHLVVSSNGSLTGDRTAFLSVYDIPKNMHNEEVAITGLINNLSEKNM